MEKCKDREHDYRLVECKDDRDTYKCTKCQHQFSERCNFDDDMS